MSKLTTKTLSTTIDANVLLILEINGQYIYPGLAQTFFADAIFEPSILKRLQRLLVDHPDGLSKSCHDWYFGNLVCAYSKTHFGLKNLLNYPSMKKGLCSLCLTQLSDWEAPIMLIFCLCLLAMFLFWLFGHIIGAILYSCGFISVLSFTTYYIDKPGAIAFGIKSVLAMLVLIIIIMSLALALMIYWPRHHNS